MIMDLDLDHAYLYLEIVQQWFTDWPFVEAGILKMGLIALTTEMLIKYKFHKSIVTCPKRKI